MRTCIITEADSISPGRRIAAVVIGRNEGERLVGCLRSVKPLVDQFVYVDSGSSDASIENARAAGGLVVVLDMTVPFSAARARNAGVKELSQLEPAPEFVQFLDGDCELQPDWISTGLFFLTQNPEYAVACGRRRERFPKASIYNQLCDVEWDTPIGDASSCGGDAIFRLTAFDEVGGFNAAVIAGEEPELCVRLRAAGWKIRRLDAEMTLHDAAMTRFGQWWKRATRSGYAYAQGFAMHGTPPERHWKRESLRIWFWALIVPLATIAITMLVGLGGLALLLLYPVSWFKTLSNQSRAGRCWTVGMIWASACVIGKFPELHGQLRYGFGRLTHRTNAIIEYKSAG